MLTGGRDSGSRRLAHSIRAAAVIVTVAAVMAGTVGAAFANAANPLPDSKGTGTIHGTVRTNADGSVTVVSGSVDVQVGGTWNWGTLSGSSTQSSCANRFGVGWAVDWAGLSSNPNLGVGAWPVKGTGLYFHVFTRTMAPNGLTQPGDYYAFTNPCKQVDAQGFPQGPWSSTHTYNVGETIPRQLCVNVYDLHGTPGHLNSIKDIDPTQNGDNSVRTNDFNPQLAQGYCFTPRLLNPTKIVTTAASASLGAAISDSAVLSGGVSPSGTITFRLYSDTACTVQVFSKAVPVTGNGTYNSGPFVPTVAGQYRWIASYSGDGSNTSSKGSCADPAEVSTVTPHPDLGIVKTGPAQVDLGRDITYGITVKNTGLISYPNATFTDAIPAGTTFVSAGPGCTNTTTTITCNVGTLAPGATSSSVTVKVHPTAIGTVTNTAKVPTDDTPSDDQYTVTTKVVAPPAITLAVDKMASVDGGATFADAVNAPSAGAPVTYRVVLHNTSTVAVHVDAVTDTIGTSTAGVCATTLVGITLAPGAFSTPCTFPGTAPAAGTSTIDIVSASVSEVGNSSNKATAVDTAKVKTPPANPVNHFVEIDPFSTVDANNDHVGHPVETAPAAGAPATFEITLYSSSEVPVRIDSITDTVNGTTVAAGGNCGQLVGSVLNPYDFSAPCQFSGTSPAAGTQVVHAIVVTASEVGNPTNTASDVTDTIVNTPPPAGQSVLGVTVFNSTDANGNGVYGPYEVANKAGDQVVHQVSVSNPNAQAFTITAVKSTIDGVTSPVCSGLVGTTVAAHASSGQCFYFGTTPPAGRTQVVIVQVFVTSASNPAITGNDIHTARVVTPPGPPSLISTTVTETVDANGDGVFSKAEAAKAAGATVSYRAVVTNTSSVPVKITALTDFRNGTTTSVVGTCLNKVLAAGASTTCPFTGTTPAGGFTLPDVVVAAVVDTNNPGNFASASDTASVTSPR